MAPKTKTQPTTQGIQTLNVTLRGMPGSPLVIHQFSEKAKKEIRDKQQKKGPIAALRRAMELLGDA